MKRNNIILLMFGLLSLLIGSFEVMGALNDATIYYSMDNSSISGNIIGDISTSTNYNATMVNSPTTGLTGVIKQAVNFDGSTQYYTNNYDFTSGNYTFVGWIKLDAGDSTFTFMDYKFGTGNSNAFTMDYAGGAFRVILDRTGNENQIMSYSTTLFNDNDWHFIAVRFVDGGTSDLWLDNSQVATKSFTGGIDEIGDGTLRYAVSSHNGALANYLDGTIDEDAIYQRHLTTSEMTSYYSQGTNPYEGTTITFSYPIQGGYVNSSAFELDVSFSEITNSSYILNGGVETLLETNSIQALKNLTGVEGLNNLTVLADTQGIINNESINFTIDTIAPNISVIGNLTQNQFEVNFSEVFSVTDSGSGLASCTINATYLEPVENASQYDRFVNCTGIATFAAAGDYNGFVRAVDKAGNVATLNVNGTIQPFVYVNFFDSGDVAIADYSVSVVSPLGAVENYSNVNNPISISPLNDGSLDLGNYSIEFLKDGYLNAEYIVPINVSSGGDTYNFTVNTSQIILRAYNRETNALITSNINFELIGPTGFSQSTTTGIITIENVSFGIGDYRVVASGTGYESETGFFTYTGQANAEKNLYLLSSTATNKGQVKIRVETPDSKAADGAIVSMLQWNPTLSSFTKVSERSADLNGEAYFDVELGTKVYVFEATKGSLTARSSEAGEIISIDGLELPLVLEGTPGTSIYFLEDVEFSISEDATLRQQNISKITYAVTNSNGLVTKGCINYFDVTGFKKVKWGDYDICVEADQFEIQTAEIAIDTNRSIAIEISLYSGDIKERLATINYVADQTISSILENLGIAQYVIFGLFIILLGVGVSTGSIGLIVGAMFGNMVIVTTVFPNFLTGGITALLGVLAVMVAYTGGNK